MTRRPKLYRRLGSAHQFGLVNGGWVSLHLAADHLLLRSSAGFMESYRRFYFADIEVITICKTVRGLLWNGVLGLLLFFSLLALLMTRGPHIASGICFGTFGALMLANIARGTTCSTFVQTRVQTRKLPLRRLRKAMRVLDQLSPLITAAQAEIDTRPAGFAAQGAPPRSASATERLPQEPPPLPGEAAPLTTSRGHIVTFTVLVLTGALAIWEARQHHAALMYVCFGAVVINIGVGIATLVRQRPRRTPRAIAALPWISVMAHGVGMPAVYTVFYFVLLFSTVQRSTPKGPPPNVAAELTLSVLRNLPGFSRVLLIYGGVCFLLGLIGFILLMTQKARGRRAEPG